MVKNQNIFLPEVLHYYGKDVALELHVLIEMVCKSMPEAYQKEMKTCLMRRIDKYVEWLPYKSYFRITVHNKFGE